MLESERGLLVYIPLIWVGVDHVFPVFIACHHLSYLLVLYYNIYIPL